MGVHSRPHKSTVNGSQLGSQADQRPRRKGDAPSFWHFHLGSIEEPSEPGRGSHRVGSASTPVTVGQGLGPPNFHERLDRVCCCSTSPSLRDALGHAKGVFAQGRSLSHRGSECLRIKSLRGEPDADTCVFDSTSNLQLIAPIRHHDHGHPRGECSLGDAHPTVTDDGSSTREDRAVGKETLQDYPVRRDLKIGRVVGSCCCDDEVAGCGQGLEGGLDERPVALLLGRACDEHDGRSTSSSHCGG